MISICSAMHCEQQCNKHTYTPYIYAIYVGGHKAGVLARSWRIVLALTVLCRRLSRFSKPIGDGVMHKHKHIPHVCRIGCVKRHAHSRTTLFVLLTRVSHLLVYILLIEPIDTVERDRPDTRGHSGCLQCRNCV